MQEGAFCSMKILDNFLVNDFRISSEIYRKLTSDVMRIEQEDLDIRCLQLLRAVIHNEERKLPEDWEENPTDNKKYAKCSGKNSFEINLVTQPAHI